MYNSYAQGYLRSPSLPYLYLKQIAIRIELDSVQQTLKDLSKLKRDRQYQVETKRFKPACHAI
ncbi:hypothetical protein FRB95_002418 [Tulasnella sp. JGI-2019a]|nr:hypothetical protein FRB95_002418 [Tulasnella sp. JGI-2019a]